MIIYLVQNKLNSKCYIGQTTKTLEIRKKQHLSKSKTNSTCMFHNAIKKYGSENFRWEILCECKDSEELNKLERFCITFWDTYRNGYNTSLGGDIIWNKGKTLSKSIKEKMSKSRIGKINGMKGKHHSEETKKRISEKVSKLKIGNKNNLGKKLSEETKSKISKSNSVKKRSPELRKRISESLKKYYKTKKGQDR